MKSKNLPKIIKILKSKGFKNLELDPVIETKYIRDQKLKKYLFTFRDEKSNKTYALRPDLSLMSLIEFSKTNWINIVQFTRLNYPTLKIYVCVYEHVSIDFISSSLSYI